MSASHLKLIWFVWSFICCFLRNAVSGNEIWPVKPQPKALAWIWSDASHATGGYPNTEYHLWQRSCETAHWDPKGENKLYLYENDPIDENTTWLSNAMHTAETSTVAPMHRAHVFVRNQLKWQTYQPSIIASNSGVDGCRGSGGGDNWSCISSFKACRI